MVKTAEYALQGMSMNKAMIKAGYSPNTAHTPSKITGKLTWEQLLEKDLPEDLLTRVHKEQMSATRPVVCDKEINMFPDNEARLRATDMAYKLLKKYDDNKLIIEHQIKDMTDEELDAEIIRLQGMFTKK